MIGFTNARCVVPFFWLLAAVLGGFHAWASRYSMNPDGVVYLDMADAYLGRDWDTALISYRSPLYPWILGLAMALFKPPPLWEFPVVHLVNYLLYLFALASFHFLLRQIVRRRNERSHRLPQWSLLTIGYSLFIWCSLTLIGLELVTPDVAVAGLVFLLTGILLRIQSGSQGWRLFALLGAVSAVGYLTKAIFLPLGTVFILLSLALVGSVKAVLPRLVASLVAFTVLASPYVIALSVAKRHLTLGDSGKFAYLFMVNERPLIHWRGDPPESGAPTHPSRVVLSDPSLYEFDGPVGGTYPMWYDLSYWNEGMRIHIAPTRHLFLIMRFAWRCLISLANEQAVILVAAIVLHCLSQGRWWRNIAKEWILLAPAAAGLTLYALTWPEWRYLGAFVVLVWLAVFLAASAPDSQQLLQPAETVSTILTGILMLQMVTSVPGWVPARSANEEYGHLLTALPALGVAPGSKVGFIGSSFSAYWAHLARVRIVAEIPDVRWDPGLRKAERPTAADRFWGMEPSARAAAMGAFLRIGVKAVLACGNRNQVADSGWQRIHGTSCLIYLPH